jgi:hypothetical protein
MTLQIPQNKKNFLTRRATIRFSGKTLLHELVTEDYTPFLIATAPGNQLLYRVTNGALTVASLPQF